MSNRELIAQIEADIKRRKNMPQRDGGPQAILERLKTINDTQGSFSLESVSALLAYVRELEQQKKQWVEWAKQASNRVDELEARAITVKFEPIPIAELGNVSDGKRHPYMFGAGYNSAIVHCGSVLLQACAAKGIPVKVEG